MQDQFPPGRNRATARHAVSKTCGGCEQHSLSVRFRYPADQSLVPTKARIARRIGSGSVAHASTTRTRSGESGVHPGVHTPLSGVAICWDLLVFPCPVLPPSKRVVPVPVLAGYSFAPSA